MKSPRKQKITEIIRKCKDQVNERKSNSNNNNNNNESSENSKQRNQREANYLK